VRHFDTGILNFTGLEDCQNVISVDNNTDFDISFGDYNISSDTTAPGTNSLINQVATDLFTDPANGDFTLKSGSNAIDAGTDLSSEMDAVDITGETRPQGTAWDIGAFE
ncbi:MAG: choice-of-anchor Q domain-containing protein, partial [Desulfatiglandaceae bacterium]